LTWVKGEATFAILLIAAASKHKHQEQTRRKRRSRFPSHVHFYLHTKPSLLLQPSRALNAANKIKGLVHNNPSFFHAAMCGESSGAEAIATRDASFYFILSTQPLFTAKQTYLNPTRIDSNWSTGKHKSRKDLIRLI
jgi:hypothetical protein